MHTTTKTSKPLRQPKTQNRDSMTVLLKHLFPDKQEHSQIARVREMKVNDLLLPEFLQISQHLLRLLHLFDVVSAFTGKPNNLSVAWLVNTRVILSALRSLHDALPIVQFLDTSSVVESLDSWNKTVSSKERKGTNATTKLFVHFCDTCRNNNPMTVIQIFFWINAHNQIPSSAIQSHTV